MVSLNKRTDYVNTRERQEEELHKKRNKNSLDDVGNRRRVERDIF